MQIAGLEECSFVDYPGKLAATVFLRGCNLNCFYCHNQGLLDRRSALPVISRDSLLKFLQKRINFLDGVVITGGEPTINRDLPDLINSIRNLGFSVKLDTNGTRPAMIKKMIREENLDYIAMDVKTPLPGYPQLCRTGVDTNALVESIRSIIESNVEYEFRTTVYPGMSEDDLLEICRLIAGSRKWVLQHYRPPEHLVPAGKLLSEGWNSIPDLESIAARCASIVMECRVRGKAVPSRPETEANSPNIGEVGPTALDFPEILS